MQFSTKIDGFEQKDSQGFENSFNSYEQYPLEKFFIFTIYQNYTLALNDMLKLLRKAFHKMALPTCLISNCKSYCYKTFNTFYFHFKGVTVPVPAYLSISCSDE